MRTSKYISFVLTVVTAGLLSVSPVSAGGWGWDRDAGAKARGEFGGQGSRETGTRSYQYSGDHSYQPATQSRRSFSYQPVPNDLFKAGDRVTIAKNSATLMRGQEVIATLTKGQEVVVSEVQGPWLGTSIDRDGSTTSGWISADSVVAAVRKAKPSENVGEDQSEPQPAVQRRSFSYQPAPRPYGGTACPPRQSTKPSYLYQKTDPRRYQH